jgi:hyaluronan synthase
MTEKFLGVFLEVSDDRTLTNLTLKEGYRTVYQHTSLVYTDAPLKVKKLFKQQLRWARGSQYNTLRMLPWMLGHAPILSFFFVMDILLPFILAGVMGGWVYRSITGEGYNFYEGFLKSYGIQGGIITVVALMVASSVISMSIRQIRHLSEKPSDFFRLPVFIIVSTFFLMPIRLIGFFRMAHASGWGTRAGAYAGGPGEISTDDEIAALGTTTTTSAPGLDLPDAVGGVTSTTALATATRPTTAVVTRAQAKTATKTSTRTSTKKTTKPRRRLNPLAAIPYLIGIAILTLEALFLV